MNDDENTGSEASTEEQEWTAKTISLTIVLMGATGLAEIGGGWLVWQTVRGKAPFWWAILGSLSLVLYGFLPTLQPVDTFGRLYAVYGGFFIFFSLLWGWGFDGDRPDRGDWIGGSVTLGGVLIVLFWPR